MLKKPWKPWKWSKKFHPVLIWEWDKLCFCVYVTANQNVGYFVTFLYQGVNRWHVCDHFSAWKQKKVQISVSDNLTSVGTEFRLKNSFLTIFGSISSHMNQSSFLPQNYKFHELGFATMSIISPLKSNRRYVRILSLNLCDLFKVKSTPTNRLEHTKN